MSDTAKTTHANDHQCCKPNCDRQAVAFWPVIDPDIPSKPYCRECLDETKNRVMERLLESGE